jgi:hypothetical protein
MTFKQRQLMKNLSSESDFYFVLKSPCINETANSCLGRVHFDYQCKCRRNSQTPFIYLCNV